RVRRSLSHERRWTVGRSPYARASKSRQDVGAAAPSGGSSLWTPDPPFRAGFLVGNAIRPTLGGSSGGTRLAVGRRARDQPADQSEHPRLRLRGRREAGLDL